MYYFDEEGFPFRLRFPNKCKFYSCVRFIVVAKEVDVAEDKMHEVVSLFAILRKEKRTWEAFVLAEENTLN